MRLVSHPVLCNYYVTYRCNATCSFCDIWERPSPYVTLENARQNLRDLKKLGFGLLISPGANRCCTANFPNYFRKPNRPGLITTLTTNALLYPKQAEQLRGLVDMLHFSLDSPIAEEHDRHGGYSVLIK